MEISLLLYKTIYRVFKQKRLVERKKSNWIFHDTELLKPVLRCQNPQNMRNYDAIQNSNHKSPICLDCSEVRSTDPPI